MIPQALLLAQGMNINWYLLPMVAIISLSYTATHYEMRKVILERAPILFLKVMIFLGLIFGIIAFFSRGL